MPIYGVDRYLEEAIESVVGQTLGFLDSIQLILVNDGSPDASEAICLRYRDAYPGNVIYMRQENAGVSAARNAGLEHASGEFVNFFDGDDRWDTDAFARILEFFDHNPDVDFAAARIVFFDAREDAHPMDYKFVAGREIVAIDDEPSRVHMHVSSALIRRRAIGDRRFDTRLRFAEDFAFCAPIILEKGVYGALEGVSYRYRRRPTGDSAINVSMRSRTWYFDTLEFCHRSLFEYSRARYGRVHPFLQHCVMYDLQVRLRARLEQRPFGDDVVRYKALVASLLRDIDDEVILAQRNIYVEHKLYALSLKDGTTSTTSGGACASTTRPSIAASRAFVARVVDTSCGLSSLSLRATPCGSRGVSSIIERASVSVAFLVGDERVEAEFVDRPETRRFFWANSSPMRLGSSRR